jgi:hypothetical protein
MVSSVFWSRMAVEIDFSQSEEVPHFVTVVSAA